MYRQFPEEKIKMSNKHAQILNFIIGEGAAKWSTSHQRSKFPAGEDGEGKSRPHTAGGCVGYKLLKAFNEIVMIMFGNSIKHFLLLSTHTLGNQSFGIKSINAQRYMHKMFISALLVLSKKKKKERNWNQTEVSPKRERNSWIKCDTLPLSITMQLGASALRRPRGMVWGGRREEGSGWGTHVYLWRTHFDIWQN